MQRKVAQLVIALALIATIGGHWAILQSIAWLGMVVNYSQNVPLVVAIEKTFDGNHPCALCKVVQDGKRSEKERVVLKVETKLECRLAGEPICLLPPSCLEKRSGRIDMVSPRYEPPPTPPPRWV